MLDNSWLLVGGAILLFMLLFVMARYKRDSQELQQDLQKTTQDFNQLLARYEQLNQLKNQQDQALIKAQTQVENNQIRLTERDEKIQYLTQELDEAQQRHQAALAQMTQLQQTAGINQSQLQQLQAQLQHSQNQFAQKDQEAANLNEKLTVLAQQLTQLKTSLSEKEKNFLEQQQTFAQSKQQLSQEFQNLANRILEEKAQRFSQSNQSALDHLLKPFRQQIEHFQKRVNEVHSESLKGNASLEAEIKKVLEIGLNMSQQADNLTAALKGEKKTLGNWGEMQLACALQNAGLIENEHYTAQAHFKDPLGKHKYPDFVVKLPDNKHLIIDSKMSLNDYENAVSAEQEPLQKQYLQAHIKAIRHHIDDLANKDYSNLIGVRSPNFVLMFIGIEPAYIEAMKQDSSLFNYGYERNVILVSHTTLMPILRTVANLWRIERGNREAQEISEKAGEIYNQICVIGERLAKLGSSLTAVSGHYNQTVTALVGRQGLLGKVDRFKALSAKANKTMPELDVIHNDIELEKLEILAVKEEGQ